jgi:hypothetical protein
MDSETIIYLLKGGHLSMQERTERGIWPHPPLLFRDLADELVKYLETNKWFPHEWVERKNGELIDNVSVIEKTEETFHSATEAAEHYLKNALHLPGSLDKWKVVDG